MIEIVDALRELVEPSDPVRDGYALSGIMVDRTASRPFDFEPNTLYAWEETSTHVSIGTGEVREDFAVLLVFVAASRGEESLYARDREVSEALDERRTSYMNALRHSAGRAGLWDYVLGTSLPDYLRQFEIRGVAVRASGYRLVTD